MTRVFPANGMFTPRQRELYAIYLQLYQTLITSIKVHAARRDVDRSACTKMADSSRTFKFTDEKIKTPRRVVESFRSPAAEPRTRVGMEVHDVGGGRRRRSNPA